MEVVTLIYGWMLQINAPLPVALVLQFLFTFSASGIMTSSQTLLVDLFPGKGASITASNNLVRCLLGAMATACIGPGIAGVGMGWMFTIIGLGLVANNICLPILMKKGPKWKENRAQRKNSTLTEPRILFGCIRIP